MLSARLYGVPISLLKQLSSHKHWGEKPRVTKESDFPYSISSEKKNSSDTNMHAESLSFNSVNSSVFTSRHSLHCAFHVTPLISNRLERPKRLSPGRYRWFPVKSTDSRLGRLMEMFPFHSWSSLKDRSLQTWKCSLAHWSLKQSIFLLIDRYNDEFFWSFSKARSQCWN